MNISDLGLSLHGKERIEKAVNVAHAYNFGWLGTKFVRKIDFK